MKDEKNLISLKDASKISGYSADYIGQLIRSGKIPGKQVYCNIAWMTTAQAVLDYKNQGAKDKNGNLSWSQHSEYSGIQLYYSRENTISRNSISDNEWCGISAYLAGNNLITFNNFFIFKF